MFTFVFEVAIERRPTPKKSLLMTPRICWQAVQESFFQSTATQRLPLNGWLSALEIKHRRGVAGVPFRLWAGENVPESKRLVSSSCHDSLSIRRHRKVQHAQCMPCKRSNLAHRGVAPHNDLVLRVAVSGHQLVDVLRPAQVAHLAPRVNAVERASSLRVPEANTPVCSAAPRGEQPVLMRRPRNCLHSRGVLIEPQQWCSRMR
eukprot:CAMPEP_0195589588 /NCGR_PEP_ID=MMETSP0814-20130614/33711_1 /TAXON_ID=97485 /ORGANISM="Prymnesium parvum, Strain Texoma1" /LENGTH=203 /DNA_ID=CAMNT_0040728615 /DNA_START=317 /DNA_END=929 /DNA_ORIENTATION=+